MLHPEETQRSYIFPVLTDHVLFISAEHYVEIDKTAKRIMSIREF